MSLRVCTPAPVEPRSNKVSNSNTNQAGALGRGRGFGGEGGVGCLTSHIDFKKNICPHTEFRKFQCLPVEFNML